MRKRVNAMTRLGTDKKAGDHSHRHNDDDDDHHDECADSGCWFHHPPPPPDETSAPDVVALCLSDRHESLYQRLARLTARTTEETCALLQEPGVLRRFFEDPPTSGLKDADVDTLNATMRRRRMTRGSRMKHTIAPTRSTGFTSTFVGSGAVTAAREVHNIKERDAAAAETQRTGWNSAQRAIVKHVVMLRLVEDAVCSRLRSVRPEVRFADAPSRFQCATLRVHLSHHSWYI